MAVLIPEVKEMVDCAKRFLADETNIHELHDWAQQCKTAAQLSDKNSTIYSLASEWVAMSYRYWNEWNDVKDPLTEEEFKKWLTHQIEII